MTASSENGRVGTEFAADVESLPAGMVLPEQFGPVHVVPASGGQVGPLGSWALNLLYELFERAAALLLLVLLSPTLLVQAILISIDSPGPVLFRQPRVARSAVLPGRELKGRRRLIPPPGGFERDTLYLVPQTFPFLKFRTMHADARTRWPELYEYRFDPATFRDRTFKTDRDPRVTRLGVVLRRLTLDELPNLWCVLVGTMRLVGPRPELPELPQNYTAAEMYKFAVKPGVTGLAQINGRGLLSWGETLAWDLEYVRTRTVMLDLKILFLTIWYVVVRRGAF